MGPQGQRDVSNATADAWRGSHGAWDELEAVAFHLRARRALQRVLARFAAEGIAALPVKGIVLANTIYARPVERPIRDLDLKILPRDLARVAAIFRELGATKGGALVRHSRLAGNVVGYIDRIEVDVESHVGPPLVCTLGTAELLARATRTEEALGFAHLRIDTNDHAVVLAIDLYKDHVGAKPWSRDDLERIARQPGFDARVMAERAAAGGCRTIVHVVARHLAETRGDAAWSEVAARVRPTRPSYAERMIATLAGARGAQTTLGRIEARAASDSRVRAVAAVTAGAVWSLTGYGGVSLPPSKRREAIERG